MSDFRDRAAFIWSIAELLRGNYKQANYGKVILPLTVMRRMDCLLEGTKAKVLAAANAKGKGKAQDQILKRIAGQGFYNKSKFDFKTLGADSTHTAKNLRNFILGFSDNARDILEKFKFNEQIDKMEEDDLLFQIVKKFSQIDLHPATVSNMEMGYIYEELIRRFAEASNETAGEHYTPREVIALMVNLMFSKDKKSLKTEGVIRTLYDPAAGTGGMLSVAEEHLNKLNSKAELVLFGQELNNESYAICKADMLIRGHDPSNVGYGNSFSQDRFKTMRFDYMLSNPPFGVQWKKVRSFIEKEAALGDKGRFGAGLPRINDGSLLFLQHMISKMKEDDNGSRIAIVFNSSPLFNGDAGSGESNIRKWIIENDWLEAIIGLPEELFYNTDIGTYIWVLSNRKSAQRRGKIQLIDASEFYHKMPRSLGKKRNEITDDQIKQIVKIYGEFKEGPNSKIFDQDDFAYRRITVDRPQYLDGRVVKDKRGNTKPDVAYRDYEKVPMKETPEAYFEREVLPFAPDAWINHSQTRVGYEISFTKYFYKYPALRSLAEIRRELLVLERETEGMLKKAID